MKLTLPCMQMPRFDRQKYKKSRSLALVPGPRSWSLVPGPWSLVPVPGPWSWSLVPGPWSLVPVPGPWSLVLVPGPWSWSLVLRELCRPKELENCVNKYGFGDELGLGGSV